MAGDSVPVIRVADLVVDYRVGRKTHRAVHDISFEVKPGECVGFIGANGAGKSTTMKCIMGFIFPKSGVVEVFGARAGTVQSRQRIGYLPEVSLYYPFMKARELLELYGGLQGVSRTDLKSKIPGLLAEVGLEGKGESLLKNFSKGMQQRLGIAQAIIAEPEALILDELSSGLDPLGRHDLRDVLLRLKKEGRTIFFSSHELTEVESLSDRVIMIDEGRVVTESPIQDLLRPLNEFEIVYRTGTPDGGLEWLREYQVSDGSNYVVSLNDVNKYARAISELSTSGAEIVSTSSRTRSLEDHFIHLVSERKRVAAGV